MAVFKGRFIFISLGFIILAGLSGCAHYGAKPLKPLIRNSKQTEEQLISFDYEVFNVDDCIKYLDRDVIAKGYQPIQITLANNTNHYMSLSTNNVGIPCLSSQEVAQKVHANTTGRAVGYGVGSLFCWPLLVPAIVDGVGSSKSNKQLDADFSRKALRSQVIKPHTVINGLIFVSNDACIEDIEIEVTNRTNDQRIFLSPAKPHFKA